MITALELCPHCQDAFLRMEDGEPTCLSCGWYYNPVAEGAREEAECQGWALKGQRRGGMRQC